VHKLELERGSSKETAEARLRELDDQRRTESERVRKAAQDELDRKVAEYEQRLKEKDAKTQAIIDEQQQSFDRLLAEVRTQGRNELDEVETRFRSEMREANQNHSSEIVELRRRLEKETSDLAIASSKAMGGPEDSLALAAAQSQIRRLEDQLDRARREAEDL